MEDWTAVCWSNKNAKTDIYVVVNQAICTVSFEAMVHLKVFQDYIAYLMIVCVIFYRVGLEYPTIQWEAYR